MAWGSQRAGLNDLIQRLQDASNQQKSICVMRTRVMSDEDGVQLANVISTHVFLEELYLNGHPLGPLSIKSFSDCLAINQSLKYLSLGQETLGDEAVELLCQGLAKNLSSKLLCWDLEKKQITSKGARAIGFLLEKKHCSLETIQLGKNPISSEGIDHLFKGLLFNPSSKLKCLNLMECSEKWKNTKDAFETLRKVFCSSYCSLETLELSFNDLSQVSVSFFKVFQVNKSLKEVYLKGCQLTHEQVKTIGNALTTNETLQIIDLSENHLSFDTCQAFTQGLLVNKSLEKLILGKNPAIGDTGVLALASSVLKNSNTNLKYLDLCHNKLTVKSIVPLLEMPLKELRVFHNQLKEGVHALISALLNNVTIETLDLGANEIHGKLSHALFHALHTHPSLRTLEMGGNHIGESGHEALRLLRQANPLLDVAVDKNIQEEKEEIDKNRIAKPY